MNNVPIVFTLDENYFMPCGVALTSLLENAKKDTFYEIILLETGLTDEHKNKLESLAGIYKNCSFTFYNVESYSSAKQETLGHGELNYSVYYRFLIPEILKDYKKVIFSDLDVIFEQDISEIFNIDLSGAYLGVVKSVAVDNIKYKSELISRPNYFCAGLLVMNLEKIRNDGKDRELNDYMNCGYTFRNNDNDILNVVFDEDVVYLPPKYCFIPHRKRDLLQSPAWHKAFGKDECLDAVKNPAIIHYANKYKPWLTKKMAYKKEWMNYYKKSIFKDVPLSYKYAEADSPRKRAWRSLKRRIKSLLRGC